LTSDGRTVRERIIAETNLLLPPEQTKVVSLGNKQTKSG
jgi:hypothetical protein